MEGGYQLMENVDHYGCLTKKYCQLKSSTMAKSSFNIDFLIEIFIRFSLKGNQFHIHITFPFLTVPFLLFQNSSDPDATPNRTCSLFLLEIRNVNIELQVGRGEGLYIFNLILTFTKFLIEYN